MASTTTENRESETVRSDDGSHWATVYWDIHGGEDCAGWVIQYGDRESPTDDYVAADGETREQLIAKAQAWCDSESAKAATAALGDLTPDETWARFVGDQSPWEFLEPTPCDITDHFDIVATCETYMDGACTCEGLTDEQREIVSAKLTQHIEDQPR
jgi:hypothetical protein